MNNKKGIKLYNVLFPVWMLMIIPTVWLIILPGNFIIDSALLIISMFVLKIPDKKLFYKKHIFKIFSFGMISDFIGAGFIFLTFALLEMGERGDELYLTLPALLISSALIFIFNYFITFNKDEKIIRMKLSLIFAIFTAPYAFLIPISWIYY